MKGTSFVPLHQSFDIAACSAARECVQRLKSCKKIVWRNWWGWNLAERRFESQRWQWINFSFWFAVDCKR
jgi:hypothetical protein